MNGLEHASARIGASVDELARDGANLDDISGALTAKAVALLLLTDGPEATARHLVDLAARLKVEAIH